MTHKITVEIWSDIVCPWCYLGKRRFERALERFRHRDDVETRWRSLELDPSATSVDPMTLPERMLNVLGASPTEAQRGITYLTDLAAADGLEYHLCDARPANSLAAHRLLKLAAESGRDDALRERLSSAYVNEGGNIGDHDTLLRLAEDVGLHPASVTEVLQGNAYTSDVRQDETDAMRIGISTVPTFLFGGAYLRTGVPSTDELHDALQYTWAATNN